MKILHVTVSDKTAVYCQRDGDIVCGNSDYAIAFAFDSEWDEHEEKTARFIWNSMYHDVKFTGTQCTVPIIQDATLVEVGVYAGDLHTTTSAEIGCKRSILCKTSTAQPEQAKQYRDEAEIAAERAEAAAERVEKESGAYDVSFFCREHSTEENGFKNTGFIYIKAFTTHGLNVRITGMQSNEEYASYFRLYCTDFTHIFGVGHTVFVDQNFGQTQYPKYTRGSAGETGQYCYWYIPVAWDENIGDVPASVYIKGINYNASDVECGFIKELPESDNIIDTNPIRLDRYNTDMQAINATIGDMETALKILNEGA